LSPGFAKLTLRSKGRAIRRGKAGELIERLGANKSGKVITLEVDPSVAN
jgi:hypothetical protein